MLVFEKPSSGMDIWDYFKSLFTKSEESSPANPFIREAIERTEEEKAAYELWKNTRACDSMLDWLAQEYQAFRLDIEMDENVDFLATPSSNGFVLYFDEQLHNKQDFQYFFDFLKEKSLSLGYKPYMSDKRIYTREHWVETVERHYLKPRIQFVHDEITQELKKVKQRYGNILIELLFRDDEIVNLKFSATHYNDRMFLEEEGFQELIAKITHT